MRREPRYTRCARPAEPESEKWFRTRVPGVKTPGYFLSPLRGFELACGCEINLLIRGAIDSLGSCGMFCVAVPAWLRSSRWSVAMTEKSIFREFMASLRKRWEKEHPSLRPLTEKRGHLAKAGTFYAGVIPDSGAHVFVNFDHSTKSWEVGRFTINIVLASDEHNPMMYPFAQSGPRQGEGYYRIGFLVGKKDKWWHLKQDDDPILTQAWRPSSYENVDVVIAEAIDDVTRDVLSALRSLNVPVE
jgi:hypothetical protein